MLAEPSATKLCFVVEACSWLVTILHDGSGGCVEELSGSNTERGKAQLIWDSEADFLSMVQGKLGVMEVHSPTHLISSINCDSCLRN